MLHPLATFPLHTICQLLLSANMSCGTSSNDAQMPKQTVLPEGYTAFPDIGVAYKYFPVSPLRTWDEARRKCLEEGSSLAIIDSSDKIRYVMSIKPTKRSLHVGIHRFFDGEEWTNLKTGLPVEDIPWGTDTYDEYEDRLCMAMRPNGEGVYAEKCTDIRGTVCEIELSTHEKTTVH